MKVSVVLITYNHEKYIDQAIESVLLQQFDGDIEIIVADDCSTDSTLDIIKSYENKTSYGFTYLHNTSNLGHPKNYQRAFDSCNGEYIAILEGDDYWVSINRLQKHIDFLETHRECVLSINRMLIYYHEDEMFEMQEWSCNEEYEYYTSQQMALWNRLGNLSACVFRKASLNKLNPNIFEMDFDDWLLGIAIGKYGLLVKFKEIMSVYRKHNKGQWSSLTEFESNKRMLERIKKYNEYFDYKYNNEFNEHLRLLSNNKTSKKFKQKVKEWMPPFLLTLFKGLCPPIIVTQLKKIKF